MGKLYFIYQNFLNFIKLIILRSPLWQANLKHQNQKEIPFYSKWLAPLAQAFTT